MEGLLATLPSANDHERLIVALVSGQDAPRLVLRHQSWGEGIGWYTQKTVDLENHQVNLLRSALGAAKMPSNRSSAAPEDLESNPTSTQFGIVGVDLDSTAPVTATHVTTAPSISPPEELKVWRA